MRSLVLGHMSRLSSWALSFDIVIIINVALVALHLTVEYTRSLLLLVVGTY